MAVTRIERWDSFTDKKIELKKANIAYGHAHCWQNVLAQMIFKFVSLKWMTQIELNNVQQESQRSEVVYMNNMV